MVLKKHIRQIAVFTLFLLSVLRTVANIETVVRCSTNENDIVKSALLVDAKGVIEPGPEVCNGGAFQQNIHKLKNSFGNNNSFSVKLISASSFISLYYSLHSEKAKIPLFLFNRSIIV